MPTSFKTVNYGFPMNENDIIICKNELEPFDNSLCSDLMTNLFSCIMEERHYLSMPKHTDDLRELYLNLREDILSNL